MGFHLSPSANQDTHGTNWGTVTAARTVAWAEDVSYRGLMDAFRANRVYATEDDEMVVAFQVLSEGKRYWMGETVPITDDSVDVQIVVKVWQAKGTHDDPLDEGPYTVELISDYDGAGGRRAAVYDTFTVDSNKETKFRVNVVDGEYLYLRVREQNGQDNPIGDGDDEVDNETGEDRADGFRDDLNDSAWTTPVWFSKVR